MIRCKIADLTVDIPEAGGMAPRCRAYLAEGSESADIVISPEDYEDAAVYGFDVELTA